MLDIYSARWRRKLMAKSWPVFRTVTTACKCMNSGLPYEHTRREKTAGTQTPMNFCWLTFVSDACREKLSALYNNLGAGGIVLFFFNPWSSAASGYRTTTDTSHERDGIAKSWTRKYGLHFLIFKIRKRKEIAWFMHRQSATIYKFYSLPIGLGGRVYPDQKSVNRTQIDEGLDWWIRLVFQFEKITQFLIFCVIELDLLN